MEYLARYWARLVSVFSFKENLGSASRRRLSLSEFSRSVNSDDPEDARAFDTFSELYGTPPENPRDLADYCIERAYWVRGDRWRRIFDLAIIDELKRRLYIEATKYARSCEELATATLREVEAREELMRLRQSMEAKDAAH